ncbi:MAG: AAA family ATPase, partial [Treponema sp.]|nr:AAA family ATPase [Treponema sp.]
MNGQQNLDVKYILRKEYLSRLNNLKHKKLIKIVTGIRRCGKSTVLQMFRNQLLKSGVKEEQIIFINFEDFENKELREPDKLY